MAGGRVESSRGEGRKGKKEVQLCGQSRGLLGVLKGDLLWSSMPGHSAPLMGSLR